MNDSDKILGIPKTLLKILAGIAIFVVIAVLVSDQLCLPSFCLVNSWFIPIVVTVTLVLITFFQVQVFPALLLGVAAYFSFQKIHELLS